MSNIEWTEKTWNPVVGCTPVSPGCDLCYAGILSHRLAAMGQSEYVGLTVKRKAPSRAGGRERSVFNGAVRCLPDRLAIPLRRTKPTMYFVNSMSDLFHEKVPFEFICQVFAVMAMCPRHTFQVLTKRPERMRECLSRPDFRETVAMHAGHGGPIDWPLPNVWLGTSVEDQARADERIPHLLRCPAAVRFLSCEPLIAPVDLDTWELLCQPWSEKQPHIGRYIDWVIVGGESGPNARPCNVAWVRSIVQQCKAARTACFVKQLGTRPRNFEHEEALPMPFEWDDGGERIERWYKPADKKGGDMAEWPEDLRVREMPR